MISHEARTGTIRLCTGFSEDRIRKIYGTYFKNEQGQHRETQARQNAAADSRLSDE